MNKQQALKRDTDTKAFIEKHKLRHLFSELTKKLLLERPEDPLAFLIKYLQSRNPKMVVCIQGYDEEKRTRIATTLANKYNFSLVNVNTLFGSQEYHFLDSNTISERVVSEIKKVDNVYKGIVVSGFPNNAIQADYLQKAGILPDRYFVMFNDEPAVRAIYEKRYVEEKAQLLMDRNNLELAELKKILGQHYDQLPLAIEKATEKINSTISIRFKKVAPLDAPRIVVLHPPFLAPKSINAIVDRFSLNKISVQSSFRKLIQKQDFKNRVQPYIRQFKTLSKETQLAIIQNQCKTGTSKMKGCLISGWPNRKQNISFLKLHYLNPHLIIIFNSTKEKCVQEFQKLDPKDEIFCISDKPTTQKFKAQLKEFQSIVQGLKGHTNCQLMTLHENESQVIKTFQNLIQNPKIYS